MNRQFFAATVGVVGMVITLAGCGLPGDTPDAQWAGICSNASGDRIDDDQCGEYDEQGIATSPGLPGSYFMWIDTSTYSGRIPGIGERVTVGQRAVPQGAITAKGLPKTGGTVADVKRGGFGVKSGTVGGSKGASGT
jgi:hypothetical protein